MAKKAIQTNQPVVACDVCGRTLLRGEHADCFLHGGSRKTVCELCTARAMHEGWIREGVDNALGRQGERGGARSLLGRLRSRRVERPHGEPAFEQPPPGYDPATYDPNYYDPAAVPAEALAPLGEVAGDTATAAEPVAPPPPVTPAEPRISELLAPRDDAPAPEPISREHRNISAVPTNAERKVARALEVFNAGPHTRTVAGVARSLGTPLVAVRPSQTEGSVVTIVVGWELSWYRYEVDLADEASGVRLVAQGGELSELDTEDQSANASADDRGELHPLAPVA